jgi:hypothetical protein
MRRIFCARVREFSFVFVLVLCTFVIYVYFVLELERVEAVEEHAGGISNQTRETSFQLDSFMTSTRDVIGTAGPGVVPQKQYSWSGALRTSRKSHRQHRG